MYALLETLEYLIKKSFLGAKDILPQAYGARLFGVDDGVVQEL